MSSSFTRRAAATVGVLSLGLAMGGVLSPPAGATSVSDEASFTTAWETAGTTQIDLSADVTLTCTSGEPTRNSTTAIVVNGNGHTLTQTCAGARVLDQQDTGAITLQAITITGGDSDGNGGGLNTFGTVTVTGSTITGNHAGGGGEAGGIEADGDAAVLITGSVISGNTADNSGGGIGAQGLVTLVDSTMSNNTSGNNGGAIRAYGGASIVNSTLSNNSASSGGGAISSNTDVSLTYATVTDNTASYGGNLDVGDSVLTAFGSVVALPHTAPNCQGVASTSSNGYNVDDDGTCGFGAGAGDRSNLTTPLQLGALAANGGLAPTRLPATGSPLIDQIPAAACAAGQGITADERGVARPQAGLCDEGAVEVAVATTPTTVSPTTTAPAATAPTPVAATPAFTG